MRVRARALLPLLITVPALEACAVGVNPVSGARRAYAYSWQQEIRLGERIDVEIVEQFGVVDDPGLTAYVARLGEAVLAQSHLRRPEALQEYRDTRFTFRVLDTEVVNAFAAPGGYVYVTRGLLAHLENEAQLAVVLGHEVAHVAARHSSKGALSTGLVAVGVAGASALGEELGGVASALATIGGAGAELLLMRHSRDDERESDRLGVEYASRAGYDAAQAAHFFTALGRMSEGRSWLRSFLSTHPDPGRREETVRSLAAAHRGDEPGVVRADAYHERIDGIVMGEDPREGFIEDGVFHHPARRFSFPVPRGWEMARDGREVELAPATGTIGVLVHPGTRYATAAEAAAAFLEENRLTGVSSGGAERYGVPGRRVDATASDDDGSYRITAVWVEHEGAVLRFLALAAPDEARAMERSLATMLRGLRKLTDPGVLGVEPYRLEVVRVQRPTPFRALAEGRRRPPDLDVDALAILNGVEPDEVIGAGRRLRLPR
jgi:predicted Zn-dependent protease